MSSAPDSSAVLLSQTWVRFPLESWRGLRFTGAPTWRRTETVGEAGAKMATTGPAPRSEDDFLSVKNNKISSKEVWSWSEKSSFAERHRLSVSNSTKDERKTVFPPTTHFKLGFVLEKGHPSTPGLNWHKKEVKNYKNSTFRIQFDVLNLKPSVWMCCVVLSVFLSKIFF